MSGLPENKPQSASPKRLDLSYQKPEPTTAEVAAEVTAEITPHEAPHDTPHDTPQVAPQIERLVGIIHGAMTRTEIMEALQLKDRKDLRNRYLDPALKAGAIEMTIPDKPRSRHQQYRLTEKGRVLLAQLERSGDTQ